MKKRFTAGLYEDCGYYIDICDNHKDKDNQRLSIGEAVGLLNDLNDKSVELKNELVRIEDGLESLDILLGELSWLVDERNEDSSMDVIRECSVKLSQCITDIMFPCSEEYGVSRFHD